LIEDLTKLVGETGSVSDMSGGYEITVLDEDNFPWKVVFDVLLKAAHQVWMTRASDRLMILSKPPVE